MRAGTRIQPTPRDLEIVDLLVRRVRVLTADQVGRTFWPTARDPSGNAKRRLRELELEGLVELTIFRAHPETPLFGALVRWNRGDSEPDFGALSYRLAYRWSRPAVTTPCVIATREAGNRLGGHGGRFPRPSEVSHDIHLSQVFLHLREEDPSRAAAWVSEAKTISDGVAPGEMVPDAMIRSETETTAIEFAGTYSTEKLRAFHRFCARRRMPYEIW